MIGISKLYCGTVEPSDALRYGRRSRDLPSHLLQFAVDKKPVVVWNAGRRCNLRCIHCYSHSRDRTYANELSTDEARSFLRDIAAFGSPVVLFSGGEPLMRKDIHALISLARDLGMRTVLSTNGTLITRESALRLRDLGLSYVGISIDGLREIHDRFRGVEGSFDRAIDGVRHCRAAGLKVGLRFTINRRNYHEIPGIFGLVRDEDIPRICFYHLVYAGRGSALVDEDLSHAQTRETLDLIIDETRDLYDEGRPVEVLTVDNHADGVYLYLRLLRENPERARKVLDLLKMNGGNSSGHGIGCVSWDGSVYADQFWRHHSFGNVREHPFSEIWTDLSDPLMRKLKDKKEYVKGKCARCTFIGVCGGNLRVRAEAVLGDIWAEDPACYLTEEEIARGDGLI